MSNQIKHIRGPEDFMTTFGGAVDVSRETVERLEIYAELLRQWQPVKNLVANATLDDIWHRHFADSAQIYTLASNGARWIDMGAGAGFPGLVLAILGHGRDTPPPMLIESNGRKCAFLREVARRTDIAVDIQTARVEEVSKSQHSLQPSVVTARAMAPLSKLLEYAAPFFASSAVTPEAIGPKAVFLKGRDAQSEIADAQANWPDVSFRTQPSLTSVDGHIVIVE